MVIELVLDLRKAVRWRWSISGGMLGYIIIRLD